MCQGHVSCSLFTGSASTGAFALFSHLMCVSCLRARAVASHNWCNNAGVTCRRLNGFQCKCDTWTPQGWHHQSQRHSSIALSVVTAVQQPLQLPTIASSYCLYPQTPNAPLLITVTQLDRRCSVPAEGSRVRTARVGVCDRVWGLTIVGCWVTVGSEGAG